MAQYITVLVPGSKKIKNMLCLPFSPQIKSVGHSFLKMGQPQHLFRLFLVFLHKHHYNFCNKSTWKMSRPSSIRRRDSNSQSLEHESSSITTRPGRPDLTLRLLFVAHLAIRGRIFECSPSLSAVPTVTPSEPPSRLGAAPWRQARRRLGTLGSYGSTSAR